MIHSTLSTLVPGGDCKTTTTFRPIAEKEFFQKIEDDSLACHLAMGHFWSKEKGLCFTVLVFIKFISVKMITLMRQKCQNGYLAKK